MVAFHERLESDFISFETPKRLLSQCRQIIVYSTAYYNTPKIEYLEKLNNTFDFIKQNYFQPQTGGSIFSIDAKSQDIIDDQYDLYAHAFILMACSTYIKINDDKEIRGICKNNFKLYQK